MIFWKQKVVESISNFFGISILDESKLPPCPINSPLLVGPLSVKQSDIDDSDSNSESFVKWFGPNLQIGGAFRPSDCIARQKVAIIIPYRSVKYSNDSPLKIIWIFLPRIVSGEHFWIHWISLFQWACNLCLKMFTGKRLFNFKGKYKNCEALRQCHVK